MKDADGVQDTEGLPEVKWVPRYTGERAGKLKMVEKAVFKWEISDREPVRGDIKMQKAAMPVGG